MLTELAAAYELALIDAAAEIFPGISPIRLCAGVVASWWPGRRLCVDCAQLIDMEIAKEELESEETCDLRRRHGYGAGDAVPAPAVVTPNGVIANLAVTEFLVMINGLREPARFLVYHADRGIVNDRRTRDVPPATPAAIWSGSGRQPTSSGSCSRVEPRASWDNPPRARSSLTGDGPATGVPSPQGHEGG